MDSATFRAVHRYGAVLSVVGTAVAAVAYAVNGENSVVGLFLGWAGSLGVFYFVGAHLSYSASHRVAGEELLRGVAWYLGSLVGWSFVVSQTGALTASPVTVFGLPAATTLGVTLAMVGSRRVTGRDLKVRTESGQLLVTVTGAIAFGFLALSLVPADQAGWWLLGLPLVSVPVGLALRYALKRRHPDSFGVD